MQQTIPNPRYKIGLLEVSTNKGLTCFMIQYRNNNRPVIKKTKLRNIKYCLEEIDGI